jgi:hypothetical protein
VLWAEEDGFFGGAFDFHAGALDAQVILQGTLRKTESRICSRLPVRGKVWMMGAKEELTQAKALPARERQGC